MNHHSLLPLRKVKLVFSYDNKFTNKVISLVTNFKYAHIDIWLPDEKLGISSIPGVGVTIQDDSYIFKSDVWLVLDILVPMSVSPSILANNILVTSKEYLGYKYDWTSIYTYFVRSLFPASTDKFTCSEFILKILNDCGVKLLSPYIGNEKLSDTELIIYDNISPRDIFLSPYLIIDKDNVQTSL